MHLDTLLAAYLQLGILMTRVRLDSFAALWSAHQSQMKGTLKNHSEFVAFCRVSQI
jgi:hypothetical protein